MPDDIRITRREWNELKSILLEVRETVNGLSKAAAKDMLTSAEICKMLKIGRSTYQRYVQAGLLPQVRIMGKVYVKRLDVEKLITNGRV